MDLAILVEGGAIVGLVIAVFVLWEQRDQARVDRFARGATVDHVHFENLLGPDTSSSVSEGARLEITSMRINTMPGIDARVLWEMYRREADARYDHCCNAETLASFAGTSTGQRVIERLLDGGYIKRCPVLAGIDGMRPAYVLTEAGMVAAQR